MNGYPDNDREWTEEIITKVTPGSITMGNGWSLCYDKDKGAQPRVGGTVRLYGRGIGYVVRGVFFDGKMHRYATAIEHAEHEAASIREAKQERWSKWKAEGEAQYRRALDLLPQVLRERHERMERNAENWWDHAAYEMSVSLDAALLALHFKDDPAGLDAYHKSSINEQRRQVPGVAYDTHSGNTFGCAVALARILIERADRARDVHAAISPLVGCKEAGCHR